jgi:NAD dependent epimerase/dehydratase family enzyme
VRWNGRTAEGWAALADGADAIVNLAGASLSGDGLFPKRWTEERKRVIRESRVDAGRAVVSAIQRASRKPRVVVQASGIGVYGQSAFRLAFGEAASLLLTGQRGVPRRLLDLGFRFRFPDAEAALRDIVRMEKENG